MFSVPVNVPSSEFRIAFTLVNPWTNKEGFESKEGKAVYSILSKEYCVLKPLKFSPKKPTEPFKFSNLTTLLLFSSLKFCLNIHSKTCLSELFPAKKLGAIPLIRLSN